MAFIKIADISRPDSSNVEETTASITDVEHLSSYNWIEASSPTIAVPAQNAARHPESPLELLFRTLYIENPSFDMHSVGLVTDRNNIRKLLSFIDPKIAYTASQVDGSTGHHRIISYRFRGLKLVVRYETDGYVDTVSKALTLGMEPENDNLSGMMKSLSLHPSKNPLYAASVDSKLMIKEEGKVVPISSAIEIKTRVFHKLIDMEEVLPQLWAPQTPNLVRAYLRHGVFERPEVEDVTREMKRWEEDHQEDLKKLALLVKRIISVVRESGGHAVIRYDDQSDKLVVWKTDGGKMLPDDLYSKLDEKNSGKTEPNTVIESGFPKATLKIGDVLYDIDISRIPYLSSFVRLQRRAQPKASEFNHNTIPLFDIALKGVKLGYRHCFRSLPADVSQYLTLCETYDFLMVDVLRGQSVDNIFDDLRACKKDYDLDYGRYQKGDKSTARDAAFRLLFLILRGKFGDETKEGAKVYNAVVFVVSHPATFKSRTKAVVRAAYEKRFVVTSKQRAVLDSWCKSDTLERESDVDKTTIEEEFLESYSDYSSDYD
ncbi:hypothetical protein GX50_02895 [[Emmonsia] crescens]|uniref:Uncharacterized protein n=1 Tax=[Emmonsia] crescens TaxID=73230 RepID=A0A2B7ZMS7_9EURO|nr:hypothetical protein GX50_02895 [Emmonsia crescens]